MDAINSRTPLEIPELLEQVFLHLTQGEILRVQRVSRFWCDTISESPSLQHKLFFQPLPASKAVGKRPEFNPIVEALFPFLFEMHAFPSAWIIESEAEKTVQHWAGNPARRRAVFRPEASWRRMLPVQPAAPIDGFVLSEWNIIDDDLLEWAEVDPSRHNSALASRSAFGNNATVGLLYDIVLHRFSSYPDAGICVQWNMVRLTRDLCKKSPQRYGAMLWQLGAKDREEFWAEYDEKVEPRNTITIHAEVGRDVESILAADREASSPLVANWTASSPSWLTRFRAYYPFQDIIRASIPNHRPVNPTDLETIVDLPAGVLRAGNQANQYFDGNAVEDYVYWGRLQPGLKSVQQMLQESDED